MPMLSFILFILIACLLLVVSVVGVVLRIFFPWLLPSRRRYGHRSPGQENGPDDGGGFQSFFGQEKSRKEGEVTIDYVPPRKDFKDARPSTEVDPSDYVEYEEIPNDEKGSR